ncbi:probable DNA-directed RNA polymerases I and III subunit RPAC2 [Dendroctonus ponderosae]
MSVSQIADFSHGTSKTFVFQNEGHTLGNALKGIISSYPNVQFCGYTVPHPAENQMHLRIQMFKGQAIDALKKGLADLIQVCDITLDKFDEAVVSFNTADK